MEKSNVTPLVPKDKNIDESLNLVSSLSPVSYTHLTLPTT